MRRLGLILGLILAAMPLSGDTTTRGSGGGLSKALADGYYCQLTGCQMTAGVFVVQDGANFQIWSTGTGGSSQVQFDVSAVFGTKTISWPNASGTATLLGNSSTGSGAVVLATGAALVTPTLGAASANSINGNTFTTGTYTLTGAAGKTLTFQNSITFTGTDATSMAMPTTNATIARTDAAQSFTGTQTFSNAATVNGTFTTSGVVLNSNQAQSNGSMTLTTSAAVVKVVTRYDWTNAQVAALGAVTAGDITVGTMSSQTVVTNVYVVIKTSGATVTTLTVAIGRVSASYIDYIVASDAKAAANTVYGAVSGDRGTNLTGYDLPSYTGSTAIKAHFISTGGNLSTVTGSTGTIYIETMKLP